MIVGVWCTGVARIFLLCCALSLPEMMTTFLVVILTQWSTRIKRRNPIKMRLFRRARVHSRFEGESETIYPINLAPPIFFSLWSASKATAPPGYAYGLWCEVTCADCFNVCDVSCVARRWLFVINHHCHHHDVNQYVNTNVSVAHGDNEVYKSLKTWKYNGYKWKRRI